jgi:CrcB protein
MPPLEWKGIVCLAGGSVAGGLARWGLSAALARVAGTGFPHGIFLVNMLGCFLIGALDAWAAEGALSPAARLLWMTGFCGAFTTFSTWILDTAHQLTISDMGGAALNVFGSVIAGLALFRLGYLAARSLGLPG